MRMFSTALYSLALACSALGQTQSVNPPAQSVGLAGPAFAMPAGRANSGVHPRAGTITVSGQALDVTQAGNTPPAALAAVTVVSSAGYQPGGTPDSLLSVFGSGLAKAVQAGTPNAAGEWPQSIGGTSLEINGRAAPLVFVSPTQINCLAPGNTEMGTAAVNVKSEGVVIATGTVSITNTLPGLFSSSGTGSGPAAALNAVTYAPAPFSAQTAENAGADKRTRIALFGSGIRYAGNSAHTPNTNVASNITVSATDASGKALSLTVEYAGPAPGFAGLDQVNVVLPAEANQDTTITVKVTAGAASNAVTLELRQSGIVVTPTDSDSFAISGAQGQFTVGADRKVYTVRNAGTSAVTMQVRLPAWLTAVPATAQIAGASSVAVTVATNSLINSLAEGPYFGTIDFTDGSVTASRSVALLVQAGAPPPSTLPAGCEYAAAPTDQLFRAWNTLSSTATIQWGNVHIATGGFGSIPFGFDMRPGECDVYGLPVRGDYDISVSRSGGGSRPLVVTFDSSAGFVISGRRVYTLRIASGSCSAAADAGISFGGQAVYSVCP